jgi:hypothetical protein
VTGSEDPLTPEDEEVRRLLAEARHTGRTPPDVVARLDRVLDDLAQEPAVAAPVIDLARRRRRVASLLVAAAAVVAVGVGLSQVVSPQTETADSQATGAAPEAADEGSDSGQSKVPLNDGEDLGGAPAPSAPDAEGKSGLIRVRLNYLRDDFIAARRLRELDGQAYSPLRSANQADQAAGAACHADAWGQGRFVPVRYGKVPAVLVFRRPLGDTQVADLFLCGSTEPVRSVTLPAP